MPRGTRDAAAAAFGPGCRHPLAAAGATVQGLPGVGWRGPPFVPTFALVFLSGVCRATRARVGRGGAYVTTSGTLGVHRGSC